MSSLKHIFPAILAAIVMAAGCSPAKTDQQEEEDIYSNYYPSLETSPDFTEMVGADDTSIEYTIKCNRKWHVELTGTADWITDYTRSGEAGESTLAISFTKNTGTESRSAYLNFTYDKSEVPILLVQLGTED